MSFFKRRANLCLGLMGWGVAAGFLGVCSPGLLGVESDRVTLDFYRDIYPFLKTNCIACHNQTTSKAHLNMESPELMKKGGDTGPGLIAGKASESLIFQSAAHLGEVELMPPKGNKQGAKNFSAVELAVLQTWIDQGARSSVKASRQVAVQLPPVSIKPIYSVSLTSDGRFAACGRGNQIFIYDLASRQLVTRVGDDSLGKKEAIAHRSLVQALAFSPDGERMASGSFREVKVWRQERPAATAWQSEAGAGVVVTALFGDGKQMVCGDKQGALRVVDLVKSAVTRTILNSENKAIRLVSVSPDLSKIAVIGDDSVLNVWGVADGRRLATQEGVSGVAALEWTGNGQAILSGGESKVVQIWTLPVGDSVEFGAPRELKGATGGIVSLSCFGTEERLLVASRDGKVRLWNLIEGRQVREFGVADVLALAVSRDGKQFASGSKDGVVRVWEMETGKKVTEIRGDLDSVRRLADLEEELGRQGMELAFQSKVLARAEAQNKAMEESLKKAQETIVTATKALPEKQKAALEATEARKTAQAALSVLSAQNDAGEASGTKADAVLAKQIKEAQARVTAAEGVEEKAKSSLEASGNHVKDAEEEVAHITLKAGERTAAIAAAGVAVEAVKQLQAKATAEVSGAKAASLKKTRVLLAIAFSTDGRSVGAVFNDGALDVWAVASGVPVGRALGPEGSLGASVLAFANGTFLSSSSVGTVVSVSTQSRWVLERVLAGGKGEPVFLDRVNAVRFSPDGKTLAVGGGEPSRSGDISLWDVASGAKIREWRGRHTDAVLSLDFSPDGKRIASGGADRFARVTEIASGVQTGLFEGHTHHVLGVTFRADGRVLASAGADGVVLVWDTVAGERIKKIEGWAKEVTSVQFIGASNQIVTSSGDNIVRIVKEDGTEVRSISKLPDFMQAAASSPNGNLIIAGGEDSFLRVWDGTNAKELSVFGSQ